MRSSLLKTKVSDTMITCENDVEKDQIEKSIKRGMVTKRELEVLKYLSKGFTVKEIAELLFVSQHTIISHKKNLSEKLSARNSVDLMVKVIKLGLIEV